MKRYLITLIFILLLLQSSCKEKPSEFVNIDPSISERIEELLSQMTLEEKAGQLAQIHGSDSC